MVYAICDPPRKAAAPLSGGITLNCIDPLQDPRWEELVERHPKASVFHSRAWLQTLFQTYGYKPLACTASWSQETLDAGIVFCSVSSWLTGRRLVSLPFSDHCELLTDDIEVERAMIHALEKTFRDQRSKYLEFRPINNCEFDTALVQERKQYSLHRLELTGSLPFIFSNFHKSSIQRKIRRAERERLRQVEGRNETLVRDFYHLFTQTRKRLGVPPQPREWFLNLLDCFGAKSKIRIAYKDELPVAGLITLEHKRTLYYKYSASHLRFRNLGGVHFLLWNAIQDAKARGLHQVDFGRTNLDQKGLITFKTRWGASESKLTYIRLFKDFTPTHMLDLFSSGWRSRMNRQLISRLPEPVLAFAGQFFYKHAA